MEQETMALFDLPYQWIFPVVFISMTAVIAYSFMKYVILADDDEDDEEEEKEGRVKKGEQTASTQASTSAPASEQASPQAGEQPKENDSK